jgi:hypothetical protein
MIRIGKKKVNNDKYFETEGVYSNTGPTYFVNSIHIPFSLDQLSSGVHVWEWVVSGLLASQINCK